MGRKGISALLVPPSRRRLAETLLSRAGIEAVWEMAPQAEEIRKRDQQRMMQDVLFTEESTEEDLTLARTLLAEQSPEDIAAALARLYRARLPAPEDILDPGQRSSGSRYDRSARNEGQTAREEDRAAPRAPRAPRELPQQRHDVERDGEPDGERAQRVRAPKRRLH